jgi:hypothetical protein
MPGDEIWQTAGAVCHAMASMTLAMMVTNQYGTWCSADHRIIELPRRRTITDVSQKYLSIRCFDGAAIITYAGIGRVRGVDVSDWMRDVLRGETRSVNESLLELRAQATAAVGPLALRARIPHAFLASAFIQAERATVAVITNFEGPASRPTRIRSTFEISVLDANDGAVAAAGSGRYAISQSDHELLVRAATHRPRNPLEYPGLLGAINRRTAESDHPGAKAVSRRCSATYMSPSGDGVQTRLLGPSDEPEPSVYKVQHLLFGIDVGIVMENLGEFAERRITQEECDARSTELAEHSVKPEYHKK